MVQPQGLRSVAFCELRRGEQDTGQCSDCLTRGLCHSWNLLCQCYSESCKSCGFKWDQDYLLHISTKRKITEYLLFQMKLWIQTQHTRYMFKLITVVLAVWVGTSCLFGWSLVLHLVLEMSDLVLETISVAMTRPEMQMPLLQHLRWNCPKNLLLVQHVTA